MEPTSIPILLKDDGRPWSYVLLDEIGKCSFGRFKSAEEARAFQEKSEDRACWTLYREDDNGQLIREDNGTVRDGTVEDFVANSKQYLVSEGPRWEASVRHWNLVCDYYAKPTALKWLRKNLVRWYNRVRYGLKWDAAAREPGPNIHAAQKMITETRIIVNMRSWSVSNRGLSLGHFPERKRITLPSDG